MRIEPLFVSICVLVLGAGTLAPWDWRCQAAINAVGIICFCVVCASARSRRFRSCDALARTGDGSRAGAVQRLYPGKESARNCAKPRTHAQQRSETQGERGKVSADFPAERRHGGGQQPRDRRDPRGQQPVRQAQRRAARAGGRTQRRRVQFLCGAGSSASSSCRNSATAASCRTSRSISMESAMRGR